MTAFGRHGRIAALAGGGAVVVYTVGFLLWYSGTPLGLYPVLDGREMLTMARAIANGTLAPEPFYRAPLYPAALAGLLQGGVAPERLAFAARVLNGLAHLASTALIWAIARRLWRSEAAALLAAALFGLNPVVLHFAADPLDITLAMTLMLGALACALADARDRGSAHGGRRAAASVLFALAALARPQMLTLLIGWWLCVAARPRRLAAAVLPALAVLAVMGAVNYARSGDFRVLPWQGAFNLWAANHRGANGRYFEQSTRVASYAEDTNPARLEAERLYREHAPGAPLEPGPMSRFWRRRAVAAIAADPGAWLRLIAAKAWWLLNNFEQYNNKTYALHKARSPWLARNPLCWSVVLMLGVLGAAGLRGRSERRLFAALIAAYVAGLLVTYVSARFRLPLVPLGAVLAGGATRIELGRRRWAAPVAAVGLGALSLVPMPPGEARRTYVQDHLLLARAALETGHTAQALAQAARALVLAPGHPAALEIGCVARFNAWLRGEQTGAALRGVVSACRSSARDSPVARRALGVAYWRQGRDAHAAALLRKLAAKPGPERDAALAALIMIEGLEAHPDAERRCRTHHCADVLLLALAARGSGHARARLAGRLPPQELQRQLAALARTFDRRGRSHAAPPAAPGGARAGSR